MRREPPAKAPRRVKFPDYEARPKRARKSDESEWNNPVDVWDDEDGLEEEEEEEDEEGDTEDEDS